MTNLERRCLMVLRVTDIERNDELAQRPELELALKHLDAAYREIFYNVAAPDLDFNTILSLSESRLQKIYDEWYGK